jgi:hypothetical protein
MPLSSQACNTAPRQGNTGFWATANMSLILDALKKSEQMRPSVRGSDWPSAAPPARTQRVPIWAWVLMGLLAVNGAVLLTVLSKDSTPVLADSRLNPDVSAPTTASEQASTDLLPAITSPAATPPPVQKQVSSPPPRAAVFAAQAAERPSIATREELLAQGRTLPDVTLNLHVFDPQKNSRFILMNGERLQEGDSATNGLRVTAIMADGVVLSQGDTTFKVSLP